MAPNTFRNALGQAGLRASRTDSPFKAESNLALAEFQAYRKDLERQVRRGDLTPKRARDQATSAASQLRESLMARSEGYSPVPRVFLDRVIEVGSSRRRAKEALSVEALQRETNRLLREGLTEQQLTSRASEFEGKTFVRPLAGGAPAPTVDSLLGLHELATVSGDEVAREWARRQLEAIRTVVIHPEEIRRIDMACDRPDRINPRLIVAYASALSEGRTDESAMGSFVEQALQERDANACVTAFVLAREEPGGTDRRWVRAVLDGLGQFPDAALAVVRTLEAEARAEDADAARVQVEFAVAVAESEAKLAGLEVPSRAEMDRQARFGSKQLAGWDEPIGLALDRRGLTAEEYQNLGSPADETK